MHILALAPLFWATHVRAASEALLNYQNPLLGSFPGTVGWTFQPQSDLLVTSLGCFDSIVANQDPIKVGLWASDGSLLAFASVTTNSLLVNQSRYEPITAPTLSIGQTYYIGAFAPLGSISGNFVSSQDGGSATTAPEILLGLIAIATNSIFEFPGMTQGAPGSGFMGPNFEFTATPEPSSVLLLASMGAALFVIHRWRRRLNYK